MKEQAIIKKAIEGEYTVYGKPLRWSEKTKSWWYYWMSEDEEGNPIELENPACLDHPHGMYKMFLDPLFWQALGKACGGKWDGGIGTSDFPQSLYSPNYLRFAIRFHTINLTESWDKAIDYLYNLIQNPTD